VLPLMWRSASALVAPSTGVTIGGLPYEVPDFVQAGGRLGPQAFFTQGFAGGLIRTPAPRPEPVAAPGRTAGGGPPALPAGGPPRRLCDRDTGGRAGGDPETPWRHRDGARGRAWRRAAHPTDHDRIRQRDGVHPHAGRRPLPPRSRDSAPRRRADRDV